MDSLEGRIDLLCVEPGRFHHGYQWLHRDTKPSKVSAWKTLERERKDPYGTSEQ